MLCLCVRTCADSEGFGLPILTSEGRKKKKVKNLMLLFALTQADQSGGDGVLSFGDEPRHTFNDVRVHQWC